VKQIYFSIKRFQVIFAHLLFLVVPLSRYSPAQQLGLLVLPGCTNHRYIKMWSVVQISILVFDVHFVECIFLKTPVHLYQTHFHTVHHIANMSVEAELWWYKNYDHYEDLSLLNLKSCQGGQTVYLLYGDQNHSNFSEGHFNVVIMCSPFIGFQIPAQPPQQKFWPSIYYWLDWSGSGYCPVDGYCEHGNWPKMF
jgi:hypothetical protein